MAWLEVPAVLLDSGYSAALQFVSMNRDAQPAAHTNAESWTQSTHERRFPYPEDYDPWQTSIDKLCDHWSEWDGMREVLAEKAQ